MRIGVIGAGAIGGTIAALLDRGGHDVEVTARGEHLAVIRARGLTLGGAWGEHVARVAASEALSLTPDLALVCTKAQDAGAALTANRHRLGGIPVVIVQNGLTGLGEAAAALPNSDCIGGVAMYAASFLAAGRVSVTTAGATYLGVGTAEPSVPARLTAAVLDAVMPTTATANFTGCQWTKLIVNQVNAMPAITGLNVQETIADARLRRIITAGMREAVRVGFAHHVRFGSIQGLSNAALRSFAAAPVWLGQQLPLLMRRKMGATPNPGSTLQSIRRGQASEIDYLNGAVVAAAAEADRPAPINAALVRLVHEVERTGAFLAPETVVARVPRAGRDIPRPE